jgi:16S rRNA processing protein RimM
VGRLGKPNGLDGFLGLYVETEDLELLQPQAIVYVGDRPYTVRSVRRGKKGPQILFEEISDRVTAEGLRGQEVFTTGRRALGEGEFWPDQLVGLEVLPRGGSIVAVNHGPSQDRLVIERDGAHFEVPFVDALVPVVDVERGFVEIVEIEGLSSPSDRP